MVFCVYKKSNMSFVITEKTFAINSFYLNSSLAIYKTAPTIACHLLPFSHVHINLCKFYFSDPFNYALMLAIRKLDEINGNGFLGH